MHIYIRMSEHCSKVVRGSDNVRTGAPVRKRARTSETPTSHSHLERGVKKWRGFFIHTRGVNLISVITYACPNIVRRKMCKRAVCEPPTRGLKELVYCTSKLAKKKKTTKMISKTVELYDPCLPKTDDEKWIMATVTFDQANGRVTVMSICKNPASHVFKKGDVVFKNVSYHVFTDKRPSIEVYEPWVLLDVGPTTVTVACEKDGVTVREGASELAGLVLGMSLDRPVRVDVVHADADFDKLAQVLEFTHTKLPSVLRSLEMATKRDLVPSEKIFNILGLLHKTMPLDLQNRIEKVVREFSRPTPARIAALMEASGQA